MNSLRVNIYHVIAVIIYILFCIYFFFLTSSPLSYYDFEANDFLLLLLLGICSFGTLLIADDYLRFGRIGLNRENLPKLLPIIFYGVVLFAIPEEIIFRGYIQNYFVSLVPNIAAVIFLSAAVYALAHILNGATGYRPKQWNWKLVGMTFVAGIFLGLLYHLTDSLVAPTILHALFVISDKIFILKY